MSKKKWWIIPAVAFIPGIIVGALALYFYKGLVRYNGVISAHAGEPVTIERDRNGVPAIRAKGATGVFFGIGFVHAQDRLAQIEYFRAIARGRLAELIGEHAVVPDKLARTVGFHRSAVELVKRLKSPAREYLAAYAAGINLYRREMAHEFMGLLGALPEPWTDADVASILLLFEWTDAFSANRELIMPVADNEHREALMQIVPPVLQYAYGDEERNTVRALKGVRRALAVLVDESPDGFAFYIPGAQSKDGRGYLGVSIAGSIDLFPRHYPLVMESERGSISGITAAGLPFMTMGAGPALSFAGYTLRCDTQQFYLEKIAVVSGKAMYLSKGALRDFEASTETIEIKNPGGRRDRIVFTARRTERGPVISDIFSDRMKTEVVSVEALAPDEGLVAALFELPFADSVQKARAVIAGLNANPRAFLFAGSDGVQEALAGRLPVIQPPMPGAVLRDGSAYVVRTVADLSGYVRPITTEFAVLGPEILDAAPPVVKEAMMPRNTHVPARIAEHLDRDMLLDERACDRLFADTTSTLAERFAPLFSGILDGMPITSARLAKLYFNKWNLRADADSVPASIFELVFLNVLAETVRDEVGEDARDFIDNSRYVTDTFFALLEADQSMLFDDVGTETEHEYRDSIFDRAFLKALIALNKSRGPLMEEWRWGALFRGEFGLPINTRIGPLTRKIYSFRKTPLAGDSSSLNRAGVTLAGKGIAPTSVTTMVGYAHGGSMAFGTAFGISLNPWSDYYSLTPALRRIEPFAGVSGNRTLRIVPER